MNNLFTSLLKARTHKYIQRIPNPKGKGVDWSKIDTRIAQERKIAVDFETEIALIAKDKDKYVEQAKKDIAAAKKAVPKLSDMVKSQVALILGNLKSTDDALKEMGKAVIIYYTKKLNPATAEFEYRRYAK